jgi:hypothetical protein
LAAASVGTMLLGGLGASVAWSVTHQDTMALWGHTLTSQASEWLWLGVRGVVSNLIEQPWYAGVRQALGSPARLAGYGALGLTAWAGGLVALRRLLTVPGAAGSRAA